MGTIRDRQTGLSLVEILIAMTISMWVLALLSTMVAGSVRPLAWVTNHEKVQTDFFALREAFGRDVQHASTLVDAIHLDDALYHTTVGPTADSMVLRLPAVDADGNLLVGVYDFAAYTLEACGGDGTCLTRRLFTTRAASGDPLGGVGPSARLPDERILIRGVQSPHPDDPIATNAIPPVFRFDPPYVSLAREVELSVTSRSAASSRGGSAVFRTYTTRFRLRNS